MTDRDELLFGAEPVAARDSDGDGVSDIQERLDGTNPNDATDVIRHDVPSANPSYDPSDPRQHLRNSTLESNTIVDVKGQMPAGHSLDQTLGTGLDGKPISATRDHYGNTEADKLMAGHKDAHSPQDLQRDPTQQAGLGGHKTSGPPSDEIAQTTNPAHNRDLVSLDRPAVGGKEPYPPGHHNEAPKGGSSGEKAGTYPNVEDKTGPLDILTNLFSSKPEPEKTTDAEKALSAHPAEPLPTYVPPPKPDPPATDPKTMVDPDAGGGTVGGVPTDEDLARAVLKHGAATDVVQGYGGGPQIEGDSPTKRAIDFVKDPNPDDENISTATSGVAPRAPGQDISHTINRNDGILGGRDPSRGGGGGNTGVGNDGRESFSSAATAAESDSKDSHEQSGTVTSVDSSTRHGIQTVDDGSGTIATPSHERPDLAPVQGIGPLAASTPTLNASLDPNDPRGNLLHVGLENQTVVDVKSGLPAGHSVDQTLGMGLDGKPIPTTRDHYGNADAEKLLGERGGDANSPANIQRDPTLVGASTTPAAGHDALKETLGRAPGPSAGGDRSIGNQYTTPPPGEEITGTADPTQNQDLVKKDPGGGTDLSSKIPQAKDLTASQRGVDKGTPAQPTTLAQDYQAAKDWLFGSDKTDGGTPKPATGTSAGAGLDNLGAVGDKGKKMTDPDGGGDAGGPIAAPTTEQMAHAVTVHGGNIDSVQGYGGGPQIEGDSPTKQAIDLVKDPNPNDDSSSTSATGTTTAPRAPGAEVSHTINPNDGITGGRDPSPGPGGGGGDNIGRDSFSSAATAADNESSDSAPDSPGDAGTVTVVGDHASGIHSVASDDVTGIGAPSGPDGSGSPQGGPDLGERASQSSALDSAGGDDDDLEELQVQRATSLASGPGTQTEDEVYIGAPSPPADASASAGTVPAVGVIMDVDHTATIVIPGADQPADESSRDVDPDGQGTGYVSDPKVPWADHTNSGTDPVADAMGADSGVSDDSIEPMPVMREIPDDLAVPAEVDLDDGF